MSGWQSQQTGDLGPAIVQAVLARGGFLAGTLTPDPGEDLWAEVDGRRAIAQGEFPLRALFQVRATGDDTSECVLDIELDQIKRWAAQPLPVFLIGVSTPKERLFAKSIDDIVSEDLSGRDPFEIRTQRARVRPRAVENLGLVMKTAIEKHYAPSRLALSDVSNTEITSHYFEVLSRRDPAGVSIPTAVWDVLWKSPPRPQHFAAMVTELVRRARNQYGRTELRPILFFFNIFRSSEDRHYNVAAARVEVINLDHPRAEELKRTLEMPRGYNVRQDRDVVESREYWQSITMSPGVFRAYAEGVGLALDALADKVLERVRAGEWVWDDALNETFKGIKHIWENQTIAPPECRMLERVLEEQFECLLQHGYIWRNTRGRFDNSTRCEMLGELETKLTQSRGAWAVVLRTER